MSELKQFQQQVGEWGTKTFPNGTTGGRVAHMAKELRELLEAQTAEERAEEASDIFLMLLHEAHAGHFDLLYEARKKFAIVQTRKWGKPDENGVIEHIREDTQP